MNENDSNKKTTGSKVLSLLNRIKQTTESIHALESQIRNGSFYIDFRNHRVCNIASREASKAVELSLNETLKDMYTELKTVNAELNKIKGIE